MKKWKIKNGDNFYGESIFNITAYNCGRNCVIGRHNSKRALSQVVAIKSFLSGMQETSKKEIKNI